MKHEAKKATWVRAPRMPTQPRNCNTRQWQTMQLRAGEAPEEISSHTRQIFHLDSDNEQSHRRKKPNPELKKKNDTFNLKNPSYFRRPQTAQHSQQCYRRLLYPLLCRDIRYISCSLLCSRSTGVNRIISTPVSISTGTTRTLINTGTHSKVLH